MNVNTVKQKRTVETRLGEIARVRTGKLDANAQRPGGRYPFFTCGEETLEIDHYAFDTEAVLLAGNGNFNVKWYKGKFNAYQRTYVIEPRGVNGKWMFYAVQAALRKITSGHRGSVIRFIRLGDIVDSTVALPPLDEQERVVAEIEKQFTRLDAGVASLKQVQTALKRYRASVLKAACEGRLVPTEAELARKENRSYETAEKLLFVEKRPCSPTSKRRRAGRLWGAGHVPELTDEERSRIPTGWVWAKVRDVGTDPEQAVQVGPMSMQSKDFTHDGVPVLNVGCVQWGRFDESKLNYLPAKRAADFDRYRIHAGDILFTRSGTVGRCAVAQPHHNGWLMTFHLLRARPNPQKCLPDFLRIVFEGAPHIRRQTRAASVGSTRAGFNTNLLANLAVPLPPHPEQQRIVWEVERRLSVAEELGTAIKAELHRAGRLRQSILQQAFICPRFTDEFE